MPRFAATFLSMLLCCVAAPARSEVTWLCGLGHDGVRLHCVADVDANMYVEPLPVQHTIVNGTRFPLDPQRVYTVDLWGPASDMAHVEQLAAASICYRSPGCSVVLARPTDRASAGETRP